VCDVVTSVYHAQMCVSDPRCCYTGGLRVMRNTGQGWPGGQLLGEQTVDVGCPSVQLAAHSLPCLLQVDELYEAYCIQWRLRDGASNMQRAFSNSTQSRASRESLQELGRSLQECLEVGPPLCPCSGLLGGGGAGK
jgi:hypothetical protein